MSAARGRKIAAITLPNFTLAQWRRLLLACPIPHRGCMPFGDFLMCGGISQTQWCDAAKCPDDYIIGVRHFRYLKRHDLLVRGDFMRWAKRNWRAVLCDDCACDDCAECPVCNHGKAVTA